jgi:hypothetical protein
LDFASVLEEAALEFAVLEVRAPEVCVHAAIAIVDERTVTAKSTATQTRMAMPR